MLDSDSQVIKYLFISCNLTRVKNWLVRTSCMVMMKFAENFRDTDEISLKPQLCGNQTKQVSNKSLTNFCKTFGEF